MATKKKKVDWRTRAQERVKESARGTKFKLKAGPNCFRILPNAEDPDGPPIIEYLIHTDVGPHDRICKCGKDIDSKQGDCWICDEIIPKLSSSSKKSAKMRAQTLVPKEQIFAQVAEIDVDSEKWYGPLAWYVPAPKKIAMPLMALIARTKGARYYDARKGYNLNIVRTGMGRLDTNYGPLEPDDAPSKVPQHILNNLKPFSQVIPEYDEEDQRAAYYGRENSSRGGRSAVGYDDEDTTTRRSKSVAIKKKKKVVVEEEEQQQQEESQQNDEEQSQNQQQQEESQDNQQQSQNDEESENDEQQNQEEQEPSKKKGAKKVVTKKKVKPEPVKSKKKLLKKKKKVEVVEEEQQQQEQSDDEQQQEEEFENQQQQQSQNNDEQEQNQSEDQQQQQQEEEQPPPKKKFKKVVTKKKKK